MKIFVKYDYSFIALCTVEKTILHLKLFHMGLEIKMQSRILKFLLWN